MYIHTLLLAGSVLLQCGVAAAAEAPAFLTDRILEDPRLERNRFAAEGL
jgi:hypothetical protein